jgi:hypothetical protein
MKVYELMDDSGRPFAFEIDNAGLGRRGVVRVVRSIPGAAVTRTPKLLSWFREEQFCEFTVDGREFVAWEPYGDNSRYWIGPKEEPPNWCEQTAKVMDAFKNRGVLGFAAG